MMRINCQRTLVSLSLVLLLCSCGFKLRGTVAIPSWLQDVAIISETTQPELAAALKEQLRAYNIRVVDESKQAQYLLTIQKETRQQQILSIGASTSPRQYLITYTVYYSLNKAKTKQVPDSHKIVINRQLTINNNRILGSDAEDFTITHEMQRDAAVQIINRLNKS